MMRSLVCVGCLGAALAAQVAEPPTTGVLGHVEKSRVVWRKDMTLLDLVIAAKWRPDAAMSAITLLRTTGLEVLVLDVDVREMLRTGRTSENVLIQKGDLIVVPTKELVAAGKESGDAVPALLAAIAESTLAAAERARILDWRLETGKEGAGLLIPLSPLPVVRESPIGLRSVIETSRSHHQNAGTS